MLPLTRQPESSRAARPRLHALFAFAAPFKAPLIAAFTAALTTSCHDRPPPVPAVEGSGVLKSESREVAAFHSIELRGALKVELTNGPMEKLVVSGDENVIPMVSTTVTDDVLVVRETQRVTPKNPVVLTIHAPDVSRVGVHGATSLLATGLKEPVFTLLCRGSASAEIKGEVGELNVELNGVGRVNAADLVARSAKVKLSGTGSVDVNASDTLEATVSGVGHVRYRGSPKVDPHVTGVGKVEPLK